MTLPAALRWRAEMTKLITAVSFKQPSQTRTVSLNLIPGMLANQNLGVAKQWRARHGFGHSLSVLRVFFVRATQFLVPKLFLFSWPLRNAKRHFQKNKPAKSD